MKKNIIITAVFAMAVMSMSACSSGNQAASTAQESDISSVQQSETAAENQKDTEKQPAAASEKQSPEASEKEISLEDKEIPGDEKTNVCNGLVVDSGVKTFMIQTENGEFLIFSLPEKEKLQDNSTDGISIGHTVKVSYTGSREDAVAVAIDNSELKTKLSPDSIKTITQINNIIKLQDQQGLSAYISYPCFVDDGPYYDIVKNEGEFMKLRREDIFNEEFSGLVDYNLFKLDESDKIIVVGDATPNYILERSDSGELKITGINAVKGPND